MSAAPLWLHQVDGLAGPTKPASRTDALIGTDGRLLAWGPEASQQATALGLTPTAAAGWLLAPPLVDPHSVLEQPWTSDGEHLESLAAAAAAAGYGTVALLPWASPWRDRPERLQGLQWREPLRLRLWGSLTEDGSGQTLAPQDDQLACGVVGLAAGADCPPLPLLERGLLLDDLGARPLLLAPRDQALSAGGFVREGVEALRAGWPTDPVASETLPLQTLLTLAAARPERRLVLMNLATAAGVALLRSAARPPLATVSWWHLLADAGHLSPTAEGWRLAPSLGAAADREALIAALGEGLLAAVAVHHQPLDPEEQLLPLDQRRPGVAGYGAPYGLVLPALWQELVERRGWTPQALWQVLCWGPAQLLGETAEGLEVGSRRWILFDPAARWLWQRQQSLSLAANQPLLERTITGAVRASGLTPTARWQLGPLAANA